MTSKCVSRTAEYMAFYRALESVRSSSNRLFYDPFVVSFLNPYLRVAISFSKIPFLTSIIYAYADFRLPGARTSAIARTRLIDDVWSEALRQGIYQIVILGSGFDCRAYRLPDASSAVIFEVDKTDILAMKRNKLQQTIHEIPKNIRYVYTDFNRENLSEKLEGNGFDTSEPSLFIWEGVTNYLTHDAVDSVLRYMGNLSSGSQVVFTYVHAGVLDGSEAFCCAKRLLRDVADLGEPWTFGLYPENVSGYLIEHELHLDWDLGASEYRKIYFGKRAGGMKGYEFYHVVLCHVLKKELSRNK